MLPGALLRVVSRGADWFVGQTALWLCVTLLLEAGRALYSVRFAQPIDWECYAQDGARLLGGDLDYANYLCAFGYMYYPAAFAWWYAAVVWATGGAVAGALWLHVVAHVALSALALLLFAPLVRGRGRLVFTLLPLLAQNVYRTGVSRVTNDLFSALLAAGLLLALSRRRFAVASTLFSLSVAFKMNALFYGPPLLFVYLHSMPFVRVVQHFAWMGLMQLLLPLPFLWHAPASYLRLAFNFSRKFEHRVNMAWGFAGDEVRWDGRFGLALLVLTVGFLGLFLLLVHLAFFARQRRTTGSLTKPPGPNDSAGPTPASAASPALARRVAQPHLDGARRRREDGSAGSHTVEVSDAGGGGGDKGGGEEALGGEGTPFAHWGEAVVFTLVTANFVGYTFSRGVHIQFVLWVAFSLPYLLLRAGLPWHGALGAYLLFDWAHGWTTNVVRLRALLDAATALVVRLDPAAALGVLRGELFTPLRAVTTDEVLARGLQLPRFVGVYLPESYSLFVIPASFVLLTVELGILAGLLRSLQRAR